MKKVMVGILILIPIIILLLVAAVSGIVSASAHIGVESIDIAFKDGKNADIFMTECSGVDQNGNPTVVELDFNNWFDITIMPEKATNKTVEWSISNLQYLDAEYEASYKHFLENGEPDDGIQAIHPAVTLVDGNGNDVASNTTGKFMVYGYCSFSIIASSEQHSARASFTVKGYDIEAVSIALVNNQDNQFVVGESKRAVAAYTPVDSIVTNAIWTSSDESVAIVDENGVIVAVGEGDADITVKANKYSNNATYVTSAPFRVNVVAGASAVYGNQVYTHLNTMSLAELGIGEYQSVSGATIDGGILTMSGESATVVTENGTLTITKCAEDAIVIENAHHYSQESGFVFEVGELTLKLKAKWLSNFNDTQLSEVVWTSTNQDVATVDDNGVVSAVSNGIVTINATIEGQSASVTLSVQKKIASMQVSTSTAYYEKVIGGLAREHVFASEKYVDVTQNTNKEANSTLLIIQGEPEGATVDELAQFYDAFKFEVEQGGEYAYFDETIVNKLIFKPTLEGKGKQEIVVKISAKYPKYESISEYTTQKVVIKAVYGVSVVNSAELLKAAEEQKTYAFADGNVITSNSLETSTFFYNTNPTEGVLYSEDVKVSSERRYAIVVDNDIRFSSAPFTAEVYGDVYGNNHKISADRGLLEKYNEFFRISWSDVTISNVLLRMNDLGDDTVITSGEETSAFSGRGVRVSTYHVDNSKYRVLNATIEYSIIENGRQALEFQNADVTLRGIIMRNTNNVGIYAPNRHNDHGDRTYQQRNNITIENVVVSNTVATGLSMSYERMLFRVENKKFVNRFITTQEQAIAKYGPDTRTKAEIEAMNNMTYVDFANDRYFIETFVNRGLSGSVKQRGVYDIYNWVPMSKTNLIDTGDEDLNEMVGLAAGSVLSQNIACAPFRYMHNEEYWVHLGFMAAGISSHDGVTKMNESNFVNFDLADERIGILDINDLDTSEDIIAMVLKTLSIKIFGYYADQSGVQDKVKYKEIVPGSTYEINEKFVDRLHGIY